MTEVLKNCLSVKNKLCLLVHATLKSILVPLGSCRGWRANDSVEAKLIWLAKRFNDSGIHHNFIDYTTSLPLGRRDAVWERQRSSSSHAVCVVLGSPAPIPAPRGWRGRWSWMLVQHCPQHLFCTMFTSEVSSGQGWAATEPRWWLAPSNRSLISCFAAPLLELTISRTRLRCCSGQCGWSHFIYIHYSRKLR